jgi:PBSX family phage portal protein
MTKKIKTAPPDTEETRRRRRQSLRDAFAAMAEKSEKEKAQYSRQVDYDDLFDSYGRESALGGGIRLIAPPYKPGRMYELYEQSGVLKACVDAYVNNIEGYGYNIISGESDDDNLQTEDNPEVRSLKDFFDSPNDMDSLDVLRERKRRDEEITGNAYFEVVRSRDNKPVLMFWANAQRIRITTTREPVVINVSVVRDGKSVAIPSEKRFRSYCMLSSDGASSGPRVRWFKEYGDPRAMNAETGEFVKDDVEIPASKLASEIIHFKHGNGVYGIPRWIATLLSVMGSWKANMVNFDLFDNQGIPPLIVSISGGKLTEDSFQDLLALFRKAKGAQNFHKLLILETEGEPTGFDGREVLPRLGIQNLSEYRKEDAMFLQYLRDCRQEVQKLGFRLPGMFLGISDDANFATAFIVRTTVEEQVFLPERSRFDEVINKTLVRDLAGTGGLLRFKSKGPTLQSTDGLGGLISTLVNAGVFTVNGLISFVNASYGTSIALYDKSEAWADEPIPVAVQAKTASMAPPKAALPDAEAETDAGEAADTVQKNEKIFSALRDIELVVQKFAIPDKCGCA